ncbi:Testis-specific protein 10 protein [Myotis brandtii]|uniref:Testis-specific protein 10 protein n=1 Tax=Myotis brandtii TaxID=109478 RepID=S7PBS3_MYOBR|nr:Testis-specific protein 10 protein [Myotis brandtii]
MDQEEAFPRRLLGLARERTRRHVTTKEHDFGLGAPVSEAGKYQNTLQLEQQNCGAGTGIFLLVNASVIIIIRGHRFCLWGSVYLDAHGEEDRDLRHLDTFVIERPFSSSLDGLIVGWEGKLWSSVLISKYLIDLIEDLKQTNHALKEYVRNLVNSKEVVSNQIDNLTSHNEHLCKELIKVDQLAEQLERQKNFVVDTADKELEEAKTLEADKDHYKSEAQNLRKMIRNSSKSPRRLSPSSRATHCDVELLKTTRDREELKCMLEKYERHLAEIQGNVKVLTSERDKTFLLYEQLDDERMEQMSNMTLMKETITTVEKEMKSLARKAMDTESELGRQKAENNSLRVLYENTEKDLSDTQRHLAKKKYELQLTQEKIMCLDEKIDNFTRQSIAQREEISILGATLNDLVKEKECLQACLDKKSENIASLGESLAMKEKTISGMKNIIAEMEQASRQSTEALIMCEQDISRMRRQLDETNDELAQIARERDILAHENDNLQEQFSKAKQENQALSKQLNDTHNELNDIKQKVQDTNLEVNKLKNILKSEESENRQLMDQLQKANEDAENWENKARQAEIDNNTLKLELITAEAEGNRLKEKVDALNREVEQHLNAERSYKSQICTLHKSLVKMEEELQKVQFEKVSALADLSSTRELCIKLDASKDLLNQQLIAKDQEIEMMENELDSARSEIELLRSQMTNERISMQNLEALLVANRDKEYQSQIALQEKESEIQLLKEHLCLAENKMAIQSRDVAQFRNVITQLEADLDITKRQLGTERFERERAVQELRRQNYSSNAYYLNSTIKPNIKCHSPERAHHRSPDRGLDRSLEEELDMISTRVMDFKLREAAEGLGEDSTGKKKSKFKTFKKLFGKKKRKESPSSAGGSAWKQSQAKSELIAIEAGPVGYDSEDELEESRGALGGRALSHDSIFIPESGQDPARPVRVFSQENVCDRIKALQLKIQCNVKMGPPPAPGGLPAKRGDDPGMSSEDDGLPRSPPEMSLLHDIGPSTTIKASTACAPRVHRTHHGGQPGLRCVAPVADFSCPPESSSCLDNSAAKHKLLVKPRNQRSSKMRRLSSRAQSECLGDLTCTPEEEESDEKPVPTVSAEETPSAGQQPGPRGLEEESPPGDNPSSRQDTPEVTEVTEPVPGPAPCSECPLLPEDSPHPDPDSKRQREEPSLESARPPSEDAAGDGECASGDAESSSPRVPEEDRAPPGTGPAVPSETRPGPDGPGHHAQEQAELTLAVPGPSPEGAEGTEGSEDLAPSPPASKSCLKHKAPASRSLSVSPTPPASESPPQEPTPCALDKEAAPLQSPRAEQGESPQRGAEREAPEPKTGRGGSKPRGGKKDVAVPEGKGVKRYSAEVRLEKGGLALLSKDDKCHVGAAPTIRGTRPPNGQGKGKARSSEQPGSKPPLPRKPLLQSLTLPYPPAGPDVSPGELDKVAPPPGPRKESRTVEKRLPRRGAEKGLPPAASGPGAEGQSGPPWITITPQKRRGAPEQPPNREDKPGAQTLKPEIGRAARAPERAQEPMRQADFVRSKSFLITPAKPSVDRRQGAELCLQEGLQRGISLSHQNLAAQSAAMAERDLHQLKRASYASAEQPSWMELARKKSQAWSDMPQIIK